jgi:hypothetical protein
MEIVETALSRVEQRAGVVRVAWTELAAQQRRRGEPVRVLAPGDDVMLLVDGDIVRRGWVLRYVGSGADGAYVLMFGEWLTRHVPLREFVRRVPPQRDGRLAEEL